MKKVFLFMALAAASVNSCDDLLSGAGSEGTTTTEQSVKSDTLRTSIIERTVNDSTGQYSITLQMPTDKKDKLAVIITEYMSEMLGGTYEGDYADTTALMNHYIDATLEEFHGEYAEVPNWAEEGMQLSNNMAAKKEFESSKLITYVFTNESFHGGAHGGYTVMGQTFRKSDGRRIGWDVLNKTYSEEFQELLKHGLKEYFEVGSDDELKSMLLNESDYYSIPLPQCGPMFVKKGISFVYNQYEITPYAAGLPSFVVPYDKIKPFLNATGKKLITK